MKRYQFPKIFGGALQQVVHKQKEEFQAMEKERIFLIIGTKTNRKSSLIK